MDKENPVEATARPRRERSDTRGPRGPRRPPRKKTEVEEPQDGAVTEELTSVAVSAEPPVQENTESVASAPGRQRRPRFTEESEKPAQETDGLSPRERFLRAQGKQKSSDTPAVSETPKRAVEEVIVPVEATVTPELPVQTVPAEPAPVVAAVVEEVKAVEPVPAVSASEPQTESKKEGSSESAYQGRPRPRQDVEDWSQWLSARQGSGTGTEGADTKPQTEPRRRDHREARDNRNDHRRPDRSERPDRDSRPEREARPEREQRPDRSERPDRAERTERPDRQERSERHERTEREPRPDRTERSEGRSERDNRFDRQDSRDRFRNGQRDQNNSRRPEGRVPVHSNEPFQERSMLSPGFQAGEESKEQVQLLLHVLWYFLIGCEAVYHFCKGVYLVAFINIYTPFMELYSKAVPMQSFGESLLNWSDWSWHFSYGMRGPAMLLTSWLLFKYMRYLNPWDPARRAARNAAALKRRRR